ncbi:tyrosine-type recombinase/integrase [Citrobacter freundii]|uniref:phage integrase n=1 Tax=Citrobacter freundii TaxID=546 RepID=UPI0024E0D8C6|nr:tyrosine-type recombinase/integrase [Citrobacter freundii]MEB0352868.1 tyrosine-type recombinase/integrase [Citrobacter freundii]WOR56413.1 tyrosine-type recombinase/integrase [Citrobacter freundii]HCQ6559589.1 tyrosine-type recombinase/integrase [Citrobacter freundii]
MAIKKLDGGRYEVDIRPRGISGRRVRRKFDKKADALAFERYVLANCHNKEWQDKPSDQRLLSTMITLWWSYHGKNHNYGDTYRKRLEKIDRELDYPRVHMLTRNRLMRYRADRLQSGVSAGTVNRDFCAMSSMFTLLAEVDEFHTDNPFQSVRKLKLENTEMSFLSSDEVTALLDELTGDDRRIVVLCLNTGARWGEARNLKAEHVISNKVTFVKTKTGPARTVPISEEVASYILTCKSGRLFETNYTRVRDILRRVKPDLPKGQALHVLRHTFATHFMINGGNIITLQRILGHTTIEQTMTYAHFAPDYLTDAIRFNPMKGSVHIMSTK